MPDISTTGTVKLEADTRDFEHGFSKAGQSISAFEKMSLGAFMRVGAAAVDAAVQIGKTLVGGIQDTINIASKFESGMNGFAVAAGDSLDKAGLKLDDFKNQFLELGKKLPVSTMEVQQAAIELVKGGIDPLIVKNGALESSINFALASQMDLATASNLTAKNIALFGDKSKTAADQAKDLVLMQDLLVKAGNASTVGVKELGDAVLMSGGQASLAKLDYKDYLTTLAIVTDNAPSAAEAGTSFKNFLMSLSPVSAKAKDAMAKYGLTIFDTEKAMKTLSDSGIKPAGNDMNTLREQLFKLAESTGMTEKETDKFFNQFERSAFYDAEGKFVGMRKAFELMKDSFKDMSSQDQMEAAKQIFGNDGMIAFNAIMKAGAEGFDKYSQSIDNAAGVSGTAQKTQQGLNYMMEQFNGTIEALSITIGTAFLPLATKLMGWAVGALNSVEPLFNYLSTGAPSALQGFFDALNQAFGFTTAANVSNFVEKVRGLIEGFLGFMSGSMSGNVKFANVLIDMFGEDVGSQIGETLGSIKTTITNVIAWVTENWPKIQAVIGQVIQTIIGIVQENFPKVQSVVESALGTVGNIINNILLPAFNSIYAWVQANWPNISMIINDAGTAIKDVFNAVIAVINDPVLPILQILMNAVGAVVNFIVQHWPEIREIIAKVVAGMIVKLNEAIDYVRKAFDQASNVIKWMGELVAALVKGWDDAKKAVEKAWNGIEKWFNNLPAVLKTMGDNMMKGLVDGIKAAGDSVLQAITGVVQGAVDGAKKLLGIKSPSKEFEDIGSMTMQGYINGMTGRTSEIIARTQAIMYASALTARNAVMDVVNKPFSSGGSGGTLLDGSTAHTSPDSGQTSGQGLTGEAAGNPHTLNGDGFRAGVAAAGESAPAGLSRDDWDAHDRGAAPQPVVLQLDGHTLGQVMIGRMGSAIQQDARRYGRP